MIALLIAAGEVEADLRYGDLASCSDRFILELGNDRWHEAVGRHERAPRRVARPLATCLLTFNELGLFVPKPSTGGAYQRRCTPELG